MNRHVLGMGIGKTIEVLGTFYSLDLLLYSKIPIEMITLLHFSCLSQLSPKVSPQWCAKKSHDPTSGIPLLSQIA